MILSLFIISFFFAICLALTLFLVLGRYLRIRGENHFLLREKEVLFNFVHDVGEVFAESDSIEMEPLLEKTLFYALRTTRAGAGAVYLLDPETDVLSARAIAGILPPIVRQVELDLDHATSRSQYLERLVRAQTFRRGEGLLGAAADFDHAVLMNDAERDPRIPRYSEELLRIRSLLAVPMRFRHRVMGVMVVVNPVDGEPFHENDLSLLQALADQASVSAHYVRLREELDAKRRIDYDLAVARKIQASLFPRVLPEAPGVELAAFNLPALGVGGDYYDTFLVGDHSLGIAIADVSGKGAGGAIMMSACRSALRARAPEGRRPAEVLRDLNRALAADLSEDMFVTAVYMVLDLRTREVTIARAGHEPPLLWRAGAARAEVLQSEGLALGLGGAELFDEALTETSATLRDGDAVILLTDGIMEAQNPAGEEWGPARLESTLRKAAGGSAGLLLDAVRSELIRHIGAAPYYDDMTMVALRTTARPAGT
jgi:sigma-B regulation protein RsbU (phosphoserine phosphatase)